MSTLGTKGPAIDPVEAEIIRHQLDSAVEEMAANMRKVSGSPVITEANDFSVCVLNPAGEIASFALYVTLHYGAAKQCIRSLLNHYKLEEIKAGDRFIVNDAYLGSAHLNDTGVIAPIFAGETLVGWAWSEAHLLDYGGLGFGGFAPGSSDVYQEGLRLNLVKFVEQGKPVPQVEQIIKNNVRMGAALMNDIRALLAATNVCEHKVREMVQRYGLDKYQAALEWNIKATEEVVRQRIATLEPGVYAAEEWLEHDGVVNRYYRVKCTMTVSKEELLFDFTGTDPQAPGFINAGPGAVWGFIVTPIMHQLSWDLPINDGMTRPVKVVLPPGSIVNPTPPAPTSGGHLDTAMHGVQPAVSRCLSQALSRSSDPALRARVSGLFHNSWMTESWFGPDDSGNFFLFFNLDGGAQGGGAQTVVDGLHSCGDLCQPDNHIPDVEWHEYLNPLLFLWRRPWQDSGAPGEFRGGPGTDEAWFLHGAQSAVGTIFGQGAEVPRLGVFGGLSAGGHRYEFYRGVDMEERLTEGRLPVSLQELQELASQVGGKKEQPAFKSTNLRLTNRDVIFRTLGGGSGLGDPLRRNPSRVQEDVRQGLVSMAAARTAYGVVLDPESLEVQADQTDELRAEIRTNRIASARIAGAPTGAGRPEPLGSPDYAGCAHCKELTAQRGWTQGAGAIGGPAIERLAERSQWLHEPLAGSVTLVEYICPKCGTLLESALDIVRAE